MSATVSACLSLEKYFCSFSNKISYISQRSESMPVPYFEGEGKRYLLVRKNGGFCFPKHHDRSIAITRRETRRTFVSGSSNTSCKEHQTGADDGPNDEHASVKNSSVHVLICQEFEQFAIAKRECLDLPLCPWYSLLAARLGPSEVGEGVTCVQTISPPSGKNREERLPISSHLISYSLLFRRFFFLRDGKRLYTAAKEGGAGGGERGVGDSNVKVSKSLLSQRMKLPVLGFRIESQHFYLYHYRFKKEISIAVNPPGVQPGLVEK